MDVFASLIARHAPEDGMHDMPVPGLAIIRYEQPTDRVPVLHQPALCIIAQGAKLVRFRHNDASDLDKRLARSEDEGGRLVVV